MTRRTTDRVVAAIETEQAQVADAGCALADLEVLQLRLCFKPPGAADIEELGGIIGRLRRGLAVNRRWMELARNGRSIYDMEAQSE